MIRMLAASAALSAAMIGFSAQAAPPGVPAKFPPGKLKLHWKKIDPEIKAAEKALLVARERLKAAMADEVFGEAGGVEAKVLNELKLSLRAVDAAIARARLAQKFDRGGD